MSFSEDDTLEEPNTTPTRVPAELMRAKDEGLSRQRLDQNTTDFARDSIIGMNARFDTSFEAATSSETPSQPAFQNFLGFNATIASSFGKSDMNVAQYLTNPSQLTFDWEFQQPAGNAVRKLGGSYCGGGTVSSVDTAPSLLFHPLTEF